MHKKIVFAGIGLALLVSPLFASAQTATASSNTSLLATLEALVAQLEQELQQLIAAKSSTPAQTQNINASSDSFANLCASYAHLQKGDTDTTTGGEVSQLQAFLGINPTTGYYGALTSIGYTNKCVGGNSQPISVAGMSEYVGANFSFWYPSSWTITYGQTAGIEKTTPTMRLFNSSNQEMMDVDELTPSNGTVSDWIDNNDSESYYFDSNSGAWMHSLTSGGQTTNQPADMSQTTMGGLHMFYLSLGLEYDDVLPLSATRFVTVSDSSKTNDVRPLARTIVATNINVATPVSTAQQLATIQAEANAYGVSAPNTSTVGSSASSLQTYTNSQYGFSLQYPNDVTVNPPCNGSQYSPESCASPELISFYAVYEGNTALNGFAYGYVLVNASKDPAAVNSCMTKSPIGTSSTTMINGNQFEVSGVGGAAAGTQEADTAYTTLRNGICYSLVDDEYSHYQGGTMTTSQAQNDLESIVQSFRFTQ